jgi:phosphoglycerate dehydrogenase-like enzyme
VIATMLALVRRLPESLDDQRARRWHPGARPRVAGKTLAILGHGEIGKRIARAATALDMRVIAISRRGGDGALAVDRLADALADAHVLVVAAPLTPATIGLIDAEMLARLPAGSYLVDVARGGIVVEGAILDALRAGHLAGAALDVFATEPLPPDHPLWSTPNAIVTPHIAGWGERYLERCVDVLAANVDRLDAGAPRIHLVDRAAGY